MEAHVLNGSSPRVRGTVICITFNTILARFIPACAGNSATEGAVQACRAVHPRVCGEQAAAQFHAQDFPGSSPRVRGTAGSGMLWNSRGRFIPACAGNSCVKVLAVASPAVHPRVCGEQYTPPATIWNLIGSSPRVRGTGSTQKNYASKRRFIPACAGNSG